MQMPSHVRHYRFLGVFTAMLLFMLLAAACGPGEPEDGSAISADDEAEPADAAGTTETEPPESNDAESGEDATNGAEVAEFYADQTITLVVPFGPGGSYDTYARFIAPALEEAVNTSVIVENQPGAGSLLAMNTMFTREPEGLTMAFMDGVGTGAAAIVEREGVNFDLSEFSYVARVVESPYLVYAAANGPYDTFQDVLDAEGFRFGATGVGAADYVTTTVLIDLLDLNAEIVTGFEGQSAVRVGVVAGDMDALISPVDSGIQAVESGDFVPLLVIGRERVERLGDTPTILELDAELDESEAPVLEAHLNLLEFGRPVIAPPGVPEERLEFLREAFREALEDPDVMAAAAERGAPISYLPGEELQDIAAEIESVPSAEYQELLRSAYAE